MKKKIAFLVTVLALCLGGAGFYFYQNQSEDPLAAITVTRGLFQLQIQSNGLITPENRIVLSPTTAGRIDRFFVNEGDVIRPGQTLALMSSLDRIALVEASGRAPAEDLGLNSMYQPIAIKSPVAGTVIFRGLSVGQTVTTADKVFEISDRLIVQSKVDESDIAQVAVGQKVHVVVDAFRDHSLTGQVRRIGFQSVNSSGITTYDVMIELDSTQLPLRAGMSVSAKYVVVEKPQALLLPSWIAEGRENTNIEVLVPTENLQQAKTMTIEVGRSNGEFIEVLSGLNEGDTVLFRPLKIEIQNNSYMKTRKVSLRE